MTVLAANSKVVEINQDDDDDRSDMSLLLRFQRPLPQAIRSRLIELERCQRQVTRQHWSSFIDEIVAGSEQIGATNGEATLDSGRQLLEILMHCPSLTAWARLGGESVAGQLFLDIGSG